jgi:hypothetical protein
LVALAQILDTDSFHLFTVTAPFAQQKAPQSGGLFERREALRLLEL